MVDSDDIRMLQLRRGARFTHEPIATACVQPLQCNGAAELDVLRPPHRAHSAATDRFADDVAANPQAGPPRARVAPHEAREQRPARRAIVDVVFHHGSQWETTVPDKRRNRRLARAFHEAWR